MAPTLILCAGGREWPLLFQVPCLAHTLPSADFFLFISAWQTPASRPAQMTPPWFKLSSPGAGAVALLGSDISCCHTEPVHLLRICLYPQVAPHIPGAMSDSLLFFKKCIYAGPASAFSTIGGKKIWDPSSLPFSPGTSFGEEQSKRSALNILNWTNLAPTVCQAVHKHPFTCGVVSHLSSTF